MRYFSIFIFASLISFIISIFLTFLLPSSRFLFLNYFLKENINIIYSTFIVLITFSTFFGFSNSFFAQKFEAILKGKLSMFLAFGLFFYIISYLLTLANTSYSLFSFIEMNGFLFTILNFILLAPILPLMSIFTINVYTTIKSFKSSFFNLSGSAAAFISFGCPTCGSLLLSLFGVAAGLSIFPFNGIEMKLFSLALLGFGAYKLKCSRCYSSKIFKFEPLFSRKLENIVLVAMIPLASLIILNQIQLWGISTSFNRIVQASSASFFSNEIELSESDLSKITSTAMTIALVFPELKNARSEQDVMSVMLPSGIPEYSEALGGISFDDPVNSLNFLARWWFSLKEEVKQNDPQTWERFLNLAAAPRGISCEFCCGVGPQGITSDGNLRCGCKHNPALLAIALGLMKYTDYSDAQILREVMKWKTLFFPRNMISLGLQVSGKELSQIQNLPGMVGGC